MPVFQRGGNYLHRHLTKLYSDTKQSYETATAASKNAADENPDLEALRREFRIQKDRLLAWGLQWSDSNPGSSPDVEIDQKLDQAGLGQVVAMVMSNIQKLLVESEMIQNARPGVDERKSTGQVPSKASGRKSGDGTADETMKSQSLLSQLTTSIDSLYKLSESRRTHSTSSLTEKSTKDRSPPRENQTTDTTSALVPRAPQSSCLVAADQMPVSQLLRRHWLFIDSSSISLADDATSDSEMPPPYEEVMRHEKTRWLGQIVVAVLSEAQRSIVGGQGGDRRAVLIEYFPILSNGPDDLADQSRLAIGFTDRIFGQQRPLSTSHSGALLLLGHTLDVTNARHGFIFAIPGERTHQAMGYQIPFLSNLRAVIPSKREDSDPPSPSLEDRFRLGFNLLLSLLQLWIQGRRCGSLNSTNVVILLDRHHDPDALSKSGLASSDVRRPYLVHSPPPQSARPTSATTDSPSVNIYRHAADNDVDITARPWAFEVYSLGLVLLEIGLWVPLSRLWKPKYSRSTFTSRIKSIYVPKLASKCGAAYMRVVQSCVDAPALYLADLNNLSITQQAKPWYSYMIQVGRLLSRCCAIDICGPPCGPDLEYLERMNHDRAPLGTHPTIHHPNSALAVGSSTPSITPVAAAGAANTAEDVAARSVSSPSPQAAVKKWKDIDIPQECLDQWNTYLMPKISRLLQKALDSSRESCSASIMMVGRTPETARTTICIQCHSVDKVRDCLKRNFKCKEGWGLVILKGDVRRSGKACRKAKGKTNCVGATLPPPGPQNQAYQERPRFGASIGAFRDNEHLPPVSFGGAILVDGKAYGMTVHHMLDAPSDDEDESDDEHGGEAQRRSAANRPSDEWIPEMGSGCPLPTCDEYPPGASDLTLDLSDDESEGSTIRPDYIDFETGNGGFWFADDEDGTAPGLEDDAGSGSDSDSSSDLDGDDDEDDDDDRISVGDVVGIDPLDEEEIYVTQPAIDDVDDDFFPCVEDRDDEHLASHSLGYIHASSGIRRVVTGAIKHEVDWALIKIRDERLALENTIQRQIRDAKGPRGAKGATTAVANAGPRSSSSRDDSAAGVTQLTAVASSSSLSCLPVHCLARTSGLRSGRISPALALIKLHGRTSFSSSWVVEGGDFGVPGDSGAWIYDPLTGRVCGHVLAWGSQSRTAYMAPMDVLFDDIKRRLGADRVELPGGEQICTNEGIQSLSLRCPCPSPPRPPAREMESAAAGRTNLTVARTAHAPNVVQARHQGSASSMTTAPFSPSSSVYSSPSAVASGDRKANPTAQDPAPVSRPFRYRVQTQIPQIQVPIQLQERRQPQAQILPT